MRKGIAVSPGVAVGRAYCVHEIFVGDQRHLQNEAEVTAELARFEAARNKTAADLAALYQKVNLQVGAKEAAVFQVQEAILYDPALTSKVRNWVVGERLTSEAALQKVLEEYTTLFARTKDEYLRERLTDVRDCIIRISGHLSRVLQPDSGVAPGPLVLVAEELLPSHVMTLGDRDVVGIVTQTGGRTSHAAILARSRGIPAVTGISGILRQVTGGDTLVVDGRDGHVLVNPDSETASAYRKLEREFFVLKDTLAANRSQPAVTRDGESVELLANINHLTDVATAKAMGAAGVGLYRTEYLFLSHTDVPDEDEQTQAYREIIAASPGPITIRTLDLGGDKTIPYLGHQREANPFLGWRSIRLSFEHPEFFMRQIRAVLRAAGEADVEPGHVRLLFPMITTLEEIRKVQQMVRRARRQLDGKRLPRGEVPIGLMVEVPAAAVSIDSLLDVVDYISIGSNDLVQYLMAADRDNPKVSHLCQPLSPAVLKVLDDVIKACRRAGKPVTLCGEMAGMPSSFILLFAMGLRSFSMSPAFIPGIKELATHLSHEGTAQILERVLRLKTSGEIQRFMKKQLDEVCPNLKILETT